jgi:integrase
MPARHRLSTKALTGSLEPGSYPDGGGLFLKITKARADWFFRFQVRGRRRDMALGNFARSKDQRVVGEALRLIRDRADAARSLADRGVDPIEHGRLAEEVALAAAAVPEPEPPTAKSLGVLAADYITIQAAAWRGRETEKSWRRSFEKYAKAIADKPVDEVTAEDVLSVVAPIWKTMPETAGKLRERIERVLDYARVKNLRTGANPATWAGNLQFELGKRKKLTRGHHRKLDHKATPAFMTALRSRSGMAALALEWTILTAARESMTLGARWGEVDGDLWIVPKDRMKDERDHRVPLPARCLEILKAVKVGHEKPPANAVIFPNLSGDELSNTAMDAVLKRMKVNAVPHGFRSTFRDWCGDETEYAREIAEAALAHSIGNEVERAYRRSDALEKRRALMVAWAAFCGGNDPPAAPEGVKTEDDAA